MLGGEVDDTDPCRANAHAALVNTIMTATTSQLDRWITQHQQSLLFHPSR